MAKQKKKESSGLLSLTIPQRIELAQDLGDSVAAEDDSLPVPANERRLINERLRAHERDFGGAIPWRDVKAKLLEEFSPRPSMRKL